MSRLAAAPPSEQLRAVNDTIGELVYRVLRIEAFLRELDPAAFDRADAAATAQVLRTGAQRLDDIGLDR